MNREGHKDAVYFIGPEVEHTPAFSKKTLFVIGQPRIEQILLMANEYKTPHVFMGANHSFITTGNNTYWDKTITSLLDKGFWVTLDYDVKEHLYVLELLNAGIWQSRLFVPMLSVRIPKIETTSPNLTIKIDDIDFNATNPGVWCLNFHELMDSNRFTDWQDYGTDEIVAPISGPVPNPVVRIPIPSSTVVITPKTNKISPSTVIDITKESENSIMNNESLGLDPTSPSQLKPDSGEILEKISSPIITDLAAAYAEGAKEDPLGKEGSKKPVKKNKTV